MQRHFSLQEQDFLFPDFWFFLLPYGTILPYFRIVGNNLKMILLFAFLQTFLQYTMFYTGINLIPGCCGSYSYWISATVYCPGGPFHDAGRPDDHEKNPGYSIWYPGSGPCELW